MPSLMFDKCCTYIELKSGCFILGYLNLVGYIIWTIAYILAVIVGGAVSANAENTEIRNTGLPVTVISGSMLIFVLLNLAFSIVLLVGLHMNKPGHLKAYLIYSVILMVVLIIELIVTCATTSVNVTIIFDILLILLGIYSILVIRSMFYQMKNPSRGPAIYSAA